MFPESIERALQNIAVVRLMVPSGTDIKSAVRRRQAPWHDKTKSMGPVAHTGDSANCAAAKIVTKATTVGRA